MADSTARPDGVARIGRAQERQHQIGSFAHAPHRHGLAEILAMARNSDFAGGIQKAAQAQGAS